MSYILVTADFPRVDSAQRKKIYSCLEDNKWKKVNEPGRDIDTVWIGSFGNTISEKDAIQTTISEFVNCSKPYCKPKLVIHWGINKPTEYGLV